MSLKQGNSFIAGGLDPHRVIEFQAPTAANNYTWYRKYADGWVEQGIHGVGLKPSSSYFALAPNQGMEIQNRFSLPIPMSVLAKGNAELGGNSGVFACDVFLTTSSTAACWIFNANSNSVDASTLRVYITVAGMAA